MGDMGDGTYPEPPPIYDTPTHICVDKHNTVKPVRLHSWLHYTPCLDYTGLFGTGKSLRFSLRANLCKLHTCLPYTLQAPLNELQCKITRFPLNQTAFQIKPQAKLKTIISSLYRISRIGGSGYREDWGYFLNWRNQKFRVFSNENFQKMF